MRIKVQEIWGANKCQLTLGLKRHPYKTGPVFGTLIFVFEKKEKRFYYIHFVQAQQVQPLCGLLSRVQQALPIAHRFFL